MGVDVMARRPGLVLAACTWGAFLVLAAAAVQQAVRVNPPVRDSLSLIATSLAGLPAFCLLVAAALVLVEQRAAPDDTLGVIVGGAVLLSSIVAVAMIIAGTVVLPLWSTSTRASTWEPTLSPYLTGAALGSLAGVLADRAMRPSEPGGDDA